MSRGGPAFFLFRQIPPPSIFLTGPMCTHADISSILFLIFYDTALKWQFNMRDNIKNRFMGVIMNIKLQRRNSKICYRDDWDCFDLPHLPQSDYIIIVVVIVEIIRECPKWLDQASQLSLSVCLSLENIGQYFDIEQIECITFLCLSGPFFWQARPLNCSVSGPKARN